MAYFLVAVSNRPNLETCIKYSLAGFTSSASGLWTYLDIDEGDYVSFLYGARVFNLYKVERKTAYLGADSLPPWPSVTFKPSGLTYYFPFRAQLQTVRLLNEPLVRSEFGYVGENLLLRGGYRKTHFQADQTTLQAVSQMGHLSTGHAEVLDLGTAATFTPRLTNVPGLVRTPETFRFKELFLQAMVRRYLSVPENLRAVLVETGLATVDPQSLEVLSEKAFPEGHVDLLIKPATPIGVSRKAIIEIKTGAATRSDVIQLCTYRDNLGDECVGAILIAKSFSTKMVEAARREGVMPFEYGLGFPDAPATFLELLNGLQVHGR